MRTSHADIIRRLDNGEQRFQSLEKKLDALIEAVKPLPQMQADVCETKEIVEAWGAMKTAGRFIKWASTIVGALAVLWGSLKFVTTGIPR